MGILTCLCRVTIQFCLVIQKMDGCHMLCGYLFAWDCFMLSKSWIDCSVLVYDEKSWNSCRLECDMCGIKPSIFFVLKLLKKKKLGLRIILSRMRMPFHILKILRRSDIPFSSYHFHLPDTWGLPVTQSAANLLFFLPRFLYSPVFSLFSPAGMATAASCVSGGGLSGVPLPWLLVAPVQSSG